MLSFPTMQEILNFGRPSLSKLVRSYSPMTLLGVGGGPAGAAPTPGFTPDQLFGMELWLKNGNYVVGTWTDASGKGRNATQATGSLQPALNTRPEFNGVGVATGDGVDDTLATAAWTSIAQPTTLFVAFKYNVLSSGVYVADGIALGSRNTILLGTTVSFDYFAGSEITGKATHTHPSLIAAKFQGATSELYQEDVNTALGNPGTNPITGVRLFSSYVPSSWGNVDIAEYILYSVGLGAYDRLRVDNYLAAKVGMPTTFDPTTISGLQAWYKADALALSDGAAVSSWTDSSGNTRPLTQATGSKQPLFKANYLNGKPAILFDGSDDQLKTATFALSNQITVIAVLKLIANTTNAYIWDGFTHDNLNFQQLAGPNQRIYAGSSLTLGSALGITNFKLVSAIYDSTGKAWVDGGSNISGAVGLGNAAGFALGADTNNGAGSFSNVAVAEILIYNSALTDSQRQQVEGYLANKYSINAAIRPFNPLSISNTVLEWHRADYTDQSTDGGNVTKWYDLSGNGRSLVTTPATKPTYQATGGPNTLPSVRFGGSTYMSWVSGVTTLGSQPVTVIIVAKRASNNGVQQFLYQGSGSTSYAMAAFASTADRYQIGTATGTVTLDNTDDTKWNVFVNEYNGASSKTYWNGLASSAANLGTEKLLAEGLVVGANASLGINLNGDIAEIIFINGILSTQDRQTLEAYLYQRYAIGYKAPNDASLVANLKGWWDASQETYSDAQSMDASHVWHDKSGGGWNMAPGTAPTYKTAITNGRPTVRFASASSQYLTNAGFPGTASVAAATMFIVGKTGAGSFQDFACGASAQFRLTSDGSTVILTSDGNTNYGQVTSAALGSVGIASAVFDGSLSGNANRLKLWLNGVSQALSFTGTVPATLPAGNGLAVGRSFASASNYHNGDIYEVVIFNVALSDADRRAVENYLAQKYNIAV